MSKEFTKQLEAYKQAFEDLAKVQQPGFNTISIMKHDDKPTTYAAFGDSEPTTVAMLFNAFVTKTKELEDPINTPDLILTLIMLLDMDITDDFIHALQNMAIAAKSHTKQ